jgi:hypothetical protein
VDVSSCGGRNRRGAHEAIGAALVRASPIRIKHLLRELCDIGVNIRPSSFDAIAGVAATDFATPESIRHALERMIFIEIKTSNQPRVKAGFEGFFFALTESEIAAADQLGQRHKVSLFNRLSGELPITSVSEILDRSKSLNWQVSVQL